MPTAEELLARVAASSTDSADDANKLVISEDLRTITVPTGQEVLGVENDQDVRKVWFIMPKECDGTDLSGFTPYVNYINADNEKGFYRVDDLVADGDSSLVFSWTVGRRACAKSGTVRFSVVLRLMSQDGEEILKQFDTSTASMTVLPGLYTMDAPSEQAYMDELSAFIKASVREEILDNGFVTVKDAVLSVNDLPATGNTAGDMRNVESTGRNYIWDGEGWDDLAGNDVVNVTTATDAQVEALFETNDGDDQNG